MKALFQTLPLLALLSLAPAPAAAAAALTAGAASAEINPPPGTINWVTRQPYPEVLDPIFARALVIGQGESRVVIFTWDVVHTGDDAVDAIRQAVSEAIGVPPGHVLINASHTHSAPRGEFDLAPPVDPGTDAWNRSIPELAARLASEADQSRRAATLTIGRSDVSEWLFNRRPVEPGGNVRTVLRPDDPNSLPDGLRFGPIDPTLTFLQFADEQGTALASLFHMACHPVSVYPHHPGVSADWPGVAAAEIQQTFGGEALFLQGCAGDIVPAVRGVEEARQMGRFVAERAERAARQKAAVNPTGLHASSALIGLPASAGYSRQHGVRMLPAEVQVITLGDLALVALPGEPLIGLSFAIQEQSPFAHTLVLGYSNGRGGAYVGLPGHKAKGGYEMGPAGRASDEAGGFMIATAVRLLSEHAMARSGEFVDPSLSTAPPPRP